MIFQLVYDSVILLDSSLTSTVSPYTPPYSPFCPWTVPSCGSLPPIQHFSSTNDTGLPDFEGTFRPTKDNQSPVAIGSP